MPLCTWSSVHVQICTIRCWNDLEAFMGKPVATTKSFRKTFESICLSSNIFYNCKNNSVTSTYDIHIQNTAVALVALYNAKTFDRVWHVTLLNNFPSYKLCQWTFNLHSGRSIQGVHDEYVSSNHEINSGMAQGSFLINEPVILTKLKLNRQVVVTAVSRDPDVITYWGNRNLLEISTTKTHS